MPPARKANWSYNINKMLQFIREPYICIQLSRVRLKICYFFTLNGCHRDVGHQGCNHILSLLWECFWWPGMINQMQEFIKSCMDCLQHEGDLPKASLHPIMATTPLDLLHVDFTSIEMTMELNQLPRVANVLVFEDLSQSTLWHMWLPMKQLKQLPSSCIRVTS